MDYSKALEYFRNTERLPEEIKEQDISHKLVDYIFNALGEYECNNCISSLFEYVLEKEYLKNRFFHIFLIAKHFIIKEYRDDYMRAKTAYKIKKSAQIFLPLINNEHIQFIVKHLDNNVYLFFQTYHHM